MEQQTDIVVEIYSSFKYIPQPYQLQINSNSTCDALVNAYLIKHHLQSIDPNLIKVKTIDRNENNQGARYQNNDINIVLKSNDLIANQNLVYHLILEKGPIVRVSIITDRKEIFSRKISISPVTTAFEFFNLVIKAFSIHGINESYNLHHHHSGNLKPSDLPVMVFHSTGSNEFQIQLDKISKNKEMLKSDILSVPRADYDEISSITNNNLLPKSSTNLSKVLYHNSQKKKQRRLPQLSKSFSNEKRISDFNYNFQFNEEKVVTTEPFEKENKRSLPKTPSVFARNNKNQIPIDTRLDKTISKRGAITPSEPMIKTNAIYDQNNSSSSSSQASNSENKKHFSSTDNVSRGSVIPRIQSTELDFYSPNLYQLVKYCNLIAVDLSIKSNVMHTFPIELKETNFQSFVASISSRPSGPTPLIGRENSAFNTVEKCQEKRDNIVVIIERVHENDINFCNNIINIGDIVVNIDGENILSTYKESIYTKLTKNVKHEIILARYKHVALDHKANEKDEKIEELKSELHNLKKKYFTLQNLTTNNNRVIHQLNQELKHQQLTTIINHE